MQKRFDLCQNLFGISEPELQNLLKTTNGAETIRRMTVYKPGEAKLYFSDYEPCLSDEKLPCPLDVSVINIGNVWSLELANAKVGNADSLFQVASNFHGLEQMHPFQSPEQTNLSDYFYDQTQGPMAVLPTALDLVWRRYLLKQSGPYTDALLQSGKWPLDMLQKLHSSFSSKEKRGGVKITVGGWADITEAKTPDTLSLCRSVGCVVVKNALITHDQQGRFLGFRNMRVHQVLTSTLDMQFMSTTFGRQWMNVFLIATYINTLSVAWDLKVSKVFLTLIGGGVFENPIPCIFAAMATAINSVSFDGLRTPPRIYIVMKQFDKGVSRSVEAYCCAKIVSDFSSNKITLSACLEALSNMK